jgi:hypothetical protein
MPATTKSKAVDLAIAHCEAWSHQDWDAARKALADDVTVLVTTTMPGAPRTDTKGADDYMVGLEFFATPIVPGSLKVLSTEGDDRNALLHASVEIDGPPFGRMTVHGARLYLFDENDKLKDEHVVFFGAPR